MASLSETDLRAIRVFITVVDSHGLAAAQSELGMATSTISHHLSALEERLGTRLCQRGRGGFLLTPEGQKVYAAAQRLTKGLETFQTDMDSLHGELGERIAHAGDHRLAVRARAGAMEIVGFLAAALDHREDVRAARDRMIVAFQHHRAGAFGEHEAVAVLRERT